MARATFVKKAQKDYPAHGIKKGDSYYWWAFRNGGKHFSKEAPKRSQLTQSSYLSTLYDIQDRIGELRGKVSDAGDLSMQFDEIKQEVQDLFDETESNLESVPEQLQESHVNNERKDTLENAISEFDGIDCDDYDEPSEDDLRSEAIESLQLDEDDEESLQDRETEINAEMDRIKEEKLSEWLDEKCNEIENVSLD